MTTTYQTHNSKGDNVAGDKNVYVYINSSPKQQSTHLEFTIKGSISKIDAQKLNTIVTLLQQITEDPTLSVDYSDEQGSGQNSSQHIQLIFNGTERALNTIQYLYDNGQFSYYLNQAGLFR